MEDSSSATIPVSPMVEGIIAEDDGAEPPKDSLELSPDFLNKLTRDLADFARVDTSQKMEITCRSIETLTGALEVLQSELIKISALSSELRNERIPALVAHFEEINSLFEKIDKLQRTKMQFQELHKEVVSTVEENMRTMEQRMDEAERLLGGMQLKRVLSNVPLPSFITNKLSLRSQFIPNPGCLWKPVEVFNASKFFGDREDS